MPLESRKAAQRVTLKLAIACTRDEAMRFIDLQVFLDALARDPEARPSAALNALFGDRAAVLIPELAAWPAPLGLTARWDDETGELTITDEDSAPNLAALPVLLVWLYPDKLPLAYSAEPVEPPGEPVWTLVALDRIQVTMDAASVPARLAALRASSPCEVRLDLLPTRPLPRAPG